MKSNISIYLLLIPVFFMVGCVGYDRALLVTKTNIGLDIDSKPPTAEITIARREIAIQPIFPQYIGDESALPMLASFSLQGSFFNPSITAHFAGGNAAAFLVKDGIINGDPLDTIICLSKEPEDTRSWLLKAYHAMTQKTLEQYRSEARPFYFSTDTSYGIKVAWSGTTGPYPDTLKLGYNRKEIASPPIFIEKGCKGDLTKPPQVRLPSFYASIDNASGFKTITNSGVNQTQFFATGKAASDFSKRASVRRMAFKNIAPKAAEWEENSLSQLLISEIKIKFDAVSNDKKDKIIAKTKDLKLFQTDLVVDKGNYLSELNKLEFFSGLISKNIFLLHRFSMN